jgi:hypothetical protein
MFSLSELGWDELKYVLFFYLGSRLVSAFSTNPLKASKTVFITIKLLH